MAYSSHEYQNETRDEPGRKCFLERNYKKEQKYDGSHKQFYTAGFCEILFKNFCLNALKYIFKRTLHTLLMLKNCYALFQNCD